MAAPNLDIVGKETSPLERSWDSKDALLYAVGVGAGAEDPLDGRELKYTTENSIDVEQRVLPTFAVIVCGGRPDYAAIGECPTATTWATPSCSSRPARSAANTRGR